MFEDILTDEDRAKIFQFNSDPVLVEAVRKVLLSVIYSQGVIKKGKDSSPLQNASLSLVFKTVRKEAVIDNEKLGEELRGMAVGLNYLEVGLENLSKIKPKGKEEEPQGNPAV